MKYVNKERIVYIEVMSEFTQASARYTYHPAKTKTSLFGSRKKHVEEYVRCRLTFEDEIYTVEQFLNEYKQYTILMGCIYKSPHIYFKFSDGSGHTKYFSTCEELKDYMKEFDLSTYIKI